MQIQVSGRQIDVGEALRRHIEETLESVVAKYFPQGLDAQVTVARESHLFRVDCSLHVGHGLRLQAHAAAEEAPAAFSLVVQKIEKQLRRHKRRLKDRHLASRLGREQEESLLAQAYVLAAEAEDDADADAAESGDSNNPVIIAETRARIPTVTVGDAVLLMDLSDQPALLFRNLGNGQFNLVYRRPDGHVGWIDPLACEAAAAE